MNFHGIKNTTFAFSSRSSTLLQSITFIILELTVTVTSLGTLGLSLASTRSGFGLGLEHAGLGLEHAGLEPIPACNTYVNS